MKKEYKKPTIEIESVDCDDVILTSVKLGNWIDPNESEDFSELIGK